MSRFRKEPIGWHESFLVVLAVVFVVLAGSSAWVIVGMLLDRVGR
jgi:hypothetical protein